MKIIALTFNKNLIPKQLYQAKIEIHLYIQLL